MSKEKKEELVFISTESKMNLKILPLLRGKNQKKISKMEGWNGKIIILTNQERFKNINKFSFAVVRITKEKENVAFGKILNVFNAIPAYRYKSELLTPVELVNINVGVPFEWALKNKKPDDISKDHWEDKLDTVNLYPSLTAHSRASFFEGAKFGDFLYPYRDKWWVFWDHPDVAPAPQELPMYDQNLPHATDWDEWGYQITTAEDISFFLHVFSKEDVKSSKTQKEGYTWGLIAGTVEARKHRIIINDRCNNSLASVVLKKAGKLQNSYSNNRKKIILNKLIQKIK